MSIITARFLPMTGNLITDRSGRERAEMFMETVISAPAVKFSFAPIFFYLNPAIVRAPRLARQVQMRGGKRIPAQA